MYHLRINVTNAKGSFYEEPERLFDQFPKYYMKVLLGEFSANIGREHSYISKQTI